MRRLISWILTPFFLLAFASTLLFFHLLQLICLPFGPRMYRLAFDLLNYFVIQSLRVSGTTFTVDLAHSLPAPPSCIIVSNHQSMFDIPLICWYLRPFRPRFVAKQELARGIPSVSLALRQGGSVLIERKDAAGAVAKIADFAANLKPAGASGCIFPEGTRARDGQLKPFKPAGLVALLKHAPDLPLVICVIDGSWKIVAHKFLPVPFGTEIKFKVLTPLERSPGDEQDLVKRARQLVETTLREMRASGLSGVSTL